MNIHEKINLRSYSNSRINLCIPYNQEVKIIREGNEISSDRNSGYRSEISEETKQDIYSNKRAFQFKKSIPNWKPFRHQIYWKGTLKLDK